MKIYQNQKGFTLVELAIVMTIIGLLIGGILKGQELINNARITSTVAQVKAYQAAVTTFRDQYQATPGDMLNGQTRLPNCNNAMCNGNGDGLIGGGDWTVAQAALAATNTAGGEMTLAWIHLKTANLIEGIAASGTTSVAPAFGTTNPMSRLAGSGFKIASNTGTATPSTSSVVPGGVVAILMNGAVTTAISATNGVTALTPGQAAQLDRRLDDGVGDTGSVVAMSATESGCHDDDGVYAESSSARACSLVIGIDG